MKLTIILIFVSVFLFSCNDDDYPNAEIPSVVLNEFRLNFPKARDLDWERQTEAYEVDFEQKELEHTASISPAGNLLKLKQEISLNKLPLPVISGLQQHFPKKDIDELEVVKTQEHTFYQLKIDNFIFDDKIVLDESGNFSDTIDYWN